MGNSQKIICRSQIFITNFANNRIILRGIRDIGELMFKFILKGSIGTTDIIEIQGNLVAKTVVAARDKMMERLKQGAVDMVLLCLGFQQIDSRGISLFIEISDHLQGRGGKLHLVACPISLIIPMKSLGMAHFFQFYKTEDEAFKALRIASGQQLQQVLRKSSAIANGSYVKRQVAIKDHIRNKMILFKHHENACAKDIILYLQSTYAHFRDRELQLCLHQKEIDNDVTIAQLFGEYGYSGKDMLWVRDITPTPPNYREMMKRGGKLYDQALVEILVQANELERTTADSILEIAELNEESAINTLLEGNHISEEALLAAVGAELAVPTIHLASRQMTPLTLAKLPRDQAAYYCVVPLQIEDGKLSLAMVNPFDSGKLKAIEEKTGYKVIPVLATEESIRQSISKWRTSPCLRLQRSKLTRPMPAIAANSTSPGKSNLDEDSDYFEVPEVDLPIRPQAVAAPQVSFSHRFPFTMVEQYPVLDTVPLILSQSRSLLNQLEHFLGLLQKWHQEFSRVKTIDQLLQHFVTLVFSVMQPELAIVLLWQENKFVPKKYEPQLTAKVEIPEALLRQLDKNKSISIIKCTQNSRIDIGVPLMVADRLVGGIYLQNVIQGSYDEETLRILCALVTHGSLVLENMLLRQEIMKK